MPFRGYTWQASQEEGDWLKGSEGEGETEPKQMGLRDLESGVRKAEPVRAAVWRDSRQGISKSKTGHGVRELGFLMATNTTTTV